MCELDHMLCMQYIWPSVFMREQQQENTDRLDHLLVEIIALACALSNSSKYRETTCQPTQK